MLQLSVLGLCMLCIYCWWQCHSHTVGLEYAPEWDGQTASFLGSRQHGRRQLLVGTTAAATATTTATTTAATATATSITACPWISSELR